MHSFPIPQFCSLAHWGARLTTNIVLTVYGHGGVGSHLIRRITSTATATAAAIASARREPAAVESTAATEATASTASAAHTRQIGPFGNNLFMIVS